MSVGCGLFLLLAVVSCPLTAAAQYERADEDAPLSLRALVDGRVVRTGREPDWLDRGGAKTRYGGERTGSRLGQDTNFRIAQLALQLAANLPARVLAHAQINWDFDNKTDGDWPLVLETYARREWGEWERGWGLQAGIMNPPLSLEHTGPALTPKYTLTPSALNTWLWEEARVVGMEAEWWTTLPRSVRLSVITGIGWGPDECGWLLAERGFVMSDFIPGLNSELPLPRAGRSVSVFDERDFRPALYFAASAHDRSEYVFLRLGYFDNLGDQATTGVWETRFGTAGVTLAPLSWVEMQFQYLEGDIRTRPANWDSRFRALYPLLLLRHRGHRVTARYDVFKLHDEDGPPQRSAERGNAVTLAYLFEFGLYHRIGVEYVIASSHRPSGTRDPSDTGWQVSYRFRY